MISILEKYEDYNTSLCLKRAHIRDHGFFKNLTIYFYLFSFFARPKERNKEKGALSEEFFDFQSKTVRKNPRHPALRDS